MNSNIEIRQKNAIFVWISSIQTQLAFLAICCSVLRNIRAAHACTTHLDTVWNNFELASEISSESTYSMHTLVAKVHKGLGCNYLIVFVVTSKLWLRSCARVSHWSSFGYSCHCVNSVNMFPIDVGRRLRWRISLWVILYYIFCNLGNHETPWSWKWPNRVLNVRSLFPKYCMWHGTFCLELHMANFRVFGRLIAPN